MLGKMAKKCPNCGTKVGREATKCWKCGKVLDEYEDFRGKPTYSKVGGMGLTSAGILMILAGVLYLLSSLIIDLYYGRYQICLGDIAIILVFMGGFFSIMRISYVGTSICCLISGIFIAIRAALYFGITFLGALICILIAAHLIYKNRHEFGS
jgi:ribosomal protein L40E